MGKIILFPFFFLALSGLAFSQSFKGQVLGTDKQGLVGASVVLLNSTLSATTDEDGRFELNAVPPGKQSVQFSYIGFATQSQVFEFEAGKPTEIEIILVTDISSLDEVVVSAERAENAFQKVPLSVTTLSSKQIQAARVWRFDDLATLSPNFHISPAGGGYYLMSVRGINSYSRVPAAITYVDDVPIFNGYIMGYNVQDLEKMEFLRGPQGTLFGRGASGGVINIKTRRPGNEFAGFGEVSFGNNNQQRYNIGIRTPFVKDKLFFSASGVYSHINGFFTNKFDTQRVGDETAAGGNVKLSYTPNHKWMFNYDLRAERNDQDGSMTRALSKADAFKDPYLVNVDQRGATFRSFLTQAISVSHFAKKFTIKSITAYQDIRLRYENYDLDNSPLDFQSYSTPTTQPSNALTQEIRLSSAADESKRLRWTAGLFYFQSKDLDNIAYRNGKDSPPLDLGNGVKLPAPYTNVTYSTSKASGYATYGQLNYKLGNKTDLQLGLRYDNEISRLITRSELEYPGQPTQTTLPTTEVETSFGALTPKISLLQTLDERSSIYATYTRGYRPGGVNPYTNDPLYLTFAPEFSNNFELGYKIASLNQRLRWSVAAFQVNLRDQQLYTITSGFNFATLNIGDIVSRGLESELSLIIAKGLQFDWNLGLTNASYLELPYFRFGPEGTPETVDFSENRPIQSPVTTSFFAVQYSLPLGKQTIFSLRGEWKYTGKQYFDYANTIDQPAFSVFNTRMALNYKQMELAFWIRNLGDQRYLTYAYPFLLTAAQMANPRTLGLSVGTRF